MSEFAAYTDKLSIREQIDRSQAKTWKFVAEQNKLAAEAGKMRREAFLTPFALGVASVGAGAALFAAIQAHLRTVGS